MNMNKKMIIPLVAVYLLGFTNLIFSQEEVLPRDPRDYSDYISPGDTSDTSDAKENLEYIRGRIISINVKKNEIVIEQDQTHDKRTFVVSAERIPYFKIDDHVKIWVKPGENTVQDIKKIRIWHPHPTPPK